MRGGDRGEAVIAGEADKSLLMKAVRHDDPDLQMPPDNKKLTAAEIADLEAWVQRGANDPRRESATQTSEKMSLEQAQTFWPFQPRQSVAPPQDTTDHGSRTSLDGFVHAELKKHELSPVADADRRTLIRRATFDLTGLPPTREEMLLVTTLWVCNTKTLEGTCALN